MKNLSNLEVMAVSGGGLKDKPAEYVVNCITGGAAVGFLCSIFIGPAPAVWSYMVTGAAINGGVALAYVAARAIDNYYYPASATI